MVWPSSLHHICDVVLLLKERSLQKPTSASNGYATLMRPNKAESAVHSCLIPAQVVLVLRMRSVEATPPYWCNVATSCFKPLTNVCSSLCTHALAMFWIAATARLSRQSSGIYIQRHVSIDLNLLIGLTRDLL